jgi:hypothetical protein
VQAHHVADIVNGFNHGAVNFVVGNGFNKHAINFEKIDFEVF